MRSATQGKLALFDPEQSATPAQAPAAARAALAGIVRAENDPWPAPPPDAAFCGLIGEIVGVLSPATEADPAAILAQLLVGLGSALGRHPHYRVGASRHGTNEFVILVGPSGSGRKGSSWDAVEAVLADIDDAFVAGRIVCGLSSGEGLIWHVRDGQHARACDPRLLVLEPELASVLKASSREANTLSPVLRNAWDGRVLQVITKHDPARASGAHVSIIGHITAGELLRHVSDLEMANGFINRFLIIAVRRVRLLPEGGEPDHVTLAPLLARLRDAVRHAKAQGTVGLDAKARTLWWDTYGRLSAGRPGLLGAVLGRPEAHVVRLALIYALLDHARSIGVGHLQAALALWDYAARSAAFVFADSLGDRVADEIWAAISVRKGTVTRSEIRDLFDRNKSKADIDAALNALVAAGRIERGMITGRGRPSEVWSARQDSQ
ncbi:MAG: YfjI family protein [Acidimicrobiales bacterium]